MRVQLQRLVCALVHSPPKFVRTYILYRAGEGVAQLARQGSRECRACTPFCRRRHRGIQEPTEDIHRGGLSPSRRRSAAARGRQPKRVCIAACVADPCMRFFVDLVSHGQPQWWSHRRPRCGLVLSATTSVAWRSNPAASALHRGPEVVGLLQVQARHNPDSARPYSSTIPLALGRLLSGV